MILKTNISMTLRSGEQDALFFFVVVFLNMQVPVCRIFIIIKWLDYVFNILIFFIYVLPSLVKSSVWMALSHVCDWLSAANTASFKSMHS